MNANQLYKWIRLREQANVAAVMHDAAAAPAAFVPVVAVSSGVPANRASDTEPGSHTVMRHEGTHAPQSTPVAFVGATAQRRIAQARMLGARHRARDGDDHRTRSTLMFRFDAALRVYLHREPIDFGAGMNSVITLVEQSMQLDPFAGAVYVFRNRQANRLKLLLWERSGFWLILRRL